MIKDVIINMTIRRKDSKGRVLKEGEDQRKNGTYSYRWKDKMGNRHAILVRPSMN